ncbi:MAG TPA: ABC transporter ATP-binding protein [Candidatus Poseidoniales archaeon]|nr:ABC transporter ATP-binding protein [Candidatus Poseidoniales archaeon]
MSTTAPAVLFDHVSKWYGTVIGLNELSVAISGGVTGLLGLNGAGKSTFLKLIVGRLKPSKGTVRLFGIDPWKNTAPFARIGYCAETERMHDWMTAHQFVTTFGRLYGYRRSEAEGRSEKMLELVGLTDVMHRTVGTYSKGMRQRVKIAHALVNEPDLLILDEPLHGCDPIARTVIMDVIRRLGNEGRTIIVTSHILAEIERITEQILILHNGRLLALGNIHAIRNLLDKHPHRIRIGVEYPRELISHFTGHGSIIGFDIEKEALVLRTQQLDTVHADLPTVLLKCGQEVHSIDNPDDNLEAVIGYLVEGRR